MYGCSCRPQRLSGPEVFSQSVDPRLVWLSSCSSPMVPPGPNYVSVVFGVVKSAGTLGSRGQGVVEDRVTRLACRRVVRPGVGAMLPEGEAV
jgi:hypothetical protein